MSLSDTVVVMRQGRIEQTGTPQEIYNQPNSLYVAGFMGYSNRLSGMLMGKDGEYWQIETDEGLRLYGVATTGESAAWQPSKPVTLCFKLEETLADPLPSTNQMRGQAQLVEYIGKDFEVVVHLSGEEKTQLLVQSRQMPQIGAEIVFGVRPERLLVFASDEQSGSSDQTPGTSAAKSSLNTGGVTDGDGDRSQARKGSAPATVPAE